MTHRNAVAWFEIPVLDLNRAQAFYETVLAAALGRETMGGSELGVFASDGAGAGGCLMAGASAPAPSTTGTLVYLDAGASLDTAPAPRSTPRWPGSRPRAAASPRPRYSCPATWAASRTSSTPKATASACTRRAKPHCAAPRRADPLPPRMRRAERLFELVQLIRGRRLSTAAWLAAKLEVSERTVYRDIADLMAQGVPIEGEAGVGYRMNAGFDLPPLMFTEDEARALVASVRLAQPRLDAALARQAEAALSKILAVLPAAARAAAESVAVYAPDFNVDEPTRARIEVLRVAIEVHRKLRFGYLDAQGRSSERTVRPLGCFYWGEAWTLAAWCETRFGFRSFRVDRMSQLAVSEARFNDESGKTLADLMRQIDRKGGKPPVA